MSGIDPGLQVLLKDFGLLPGLVHHSCNDFRGPVVRCDEFRRKLLEDPRRSEADFVAHRASCDACDREARQVERMEADLERLLKVAPPPDLSRRLRSARRGGWGWVALAASLAGVLAVGVFRAQLATRPDADTVAIEVMEHIAHEPKAFASRVGLAPDDYRALSPGVSLDTDGWARVVSYAAPCDILRRPGLHLVLQGADGPVTVLVITGEHVSRQQLIRADGIRGVVRPLRKGSLAVVGKTGAPVEAIAAELAARIRIRV